MAQIGELTRIVTEGANNKEDQMQTGGRLQPRPVRRNNVTVMFLDGRPVVGMENVGTEMNPVKLYEVPDPRDNKKYVLRANLIVKNLVTGELEIIKGVNFMEFIQEGERRECVVVKNRNENWVIEQGTVLKKEVKEYRTVELDIEVPLEITGTERYFMVDIDGKGVEIHEDYVNMAKSTPRPEKQYTGSGLDS